MIKCRNCKHNLTKEGRNYYHNVKFKGKERISRICPICKCNNPRPLIRVKPKLKIKCSRCKREVDLECTTRRILKMKRISKQTNYPFGKKSKGRTTLRCTCGGVFSKMGGVRR